MSGAGPRHGCRWRAFATLGAARSTRSEGLKDKTRELMVDRNKELDGKVAIVTGSARNIGRAIALELARAGAAVTVNARADGEAAGVVTREIGELGGRAIPVVADVRDQQDVERLVQETLGAFHRIDILVNNAAVRSTKDFTELTYEEWERLRCVACDGALRVSLACVPHLIARGGGCVVGIHGMGSYLAMPEGAHKSAVKDAMAGLHRGMARDLGKHNIRVNVAVVGNFATDRKSGSGALISQTADVDVPLGRQGTPQDMADLVRFLSGPYSSYISGQTIHVNGGAYMPH